MAQGPVNVWFTGLYFFARMAISESVFGLRIPPSDRRDFFFSKIFCV